jgi:hypothetical protein
MTMMIDETVDDRKVRKKNHKNHIKQLLIIINKKNILKVLLNNVKK